ncbi:MAG: lipopolysaccharide heptosyltransferase II [Acidobacteria bacterium]|nr:lipopolysaccharide heptosyltransferase II [Acidobacteriota bacterium]
MRILLRAPNWVGDVVMSLPALTALRAEFPKAHLAVQARSWVAELYRLRDEVDGVVVEDSRGAHQGREGRERLAQELRSGRFDRTVILPTSFASAWIPFRAGIPERIGYRAEGRSLLLTQAVPQDLEPGEHQIWKHLRLVSAAGARLPEKPDVSWSVGPRERAAARKLLESAGLGSRKFVAVHAASFAHAAKRWPFPRFAELLDLLHREEGLTAVLLGSEAERAVNGELLALTTRGAPVDLAGRSSLPEVLGLLAEADRFVGNDSGLAHLAGAVGTPAAVLFGPTDPEATRPWDGPRADGQPSRIAVVRSAPPCAPCRFAVCPLDHVCMRSVTARDVLTALQTLR